eukprot:gene26469-33049_t
MIDTSVKSSDHQVSTPRDNTNILQQYPEGYNASSVELLLSLQIAKYGISMYDILTPARKNEMKIYIQQGNTYDEAALIVFQEYVSARKLSPTGGGDHTQTQIERPRLLTADSLQSLNGALPISFSPLRPGPVSRATSDDGLTPRETQMKNSPLGKSPGLLRPQSMHTMSMSPSMRTVIEEGRSSRPLSKRNPFARPLSGGTAPNNNSSPNKTSPVSRNNL